MLLLNSRSDKHVQELQPVLEREGFRQGEDPGCSYEKFEEKLGHKLVIELKNMTNDLILLTDSTIKDHEEVIKEIKAVGSTIFPGKKIVTIDTNGVITNMDEESDKENKDPSLIHKAISFFKKNDSCSVFFLALPIRMG